MKTKEWMRGYEAGLEDGIEEGYLEAQDAWFTHGDVDINELVRLKNVEEQLDAAWKYLRDKDIHLPNGNCWCSDIKHVIL